MHSFWRVCPRRLRRMRQSCRYHQDADGQCRVHDHGSTGFTQDNDQLRKENRELLANRHQIEENVTTRSSVSCSPMKRPGVTRPDRCRCAFFTDGAWMRCPSLFPSVTPTKVAVTSRWVWASMTLGGGRNFRQPDLGRTAGCRR